MIKFRCRRCHKIFQIKNMKVQKRYCDKCAKLEKNLNTYRSDVKHNRYDRRIIRDENIRIAMRGRWIINDHMTININHNIYCINCKTLIGKEIIQNKYDDIQLNNNVIYDYGNREILCKKCKLIIGILETFE